MTSSRKVGGTVATDRAGCDKTSNVHLRRRREDGPEAMIAPSHRGFLDRLAAELTLRDPDGSRLRRVDDPGALAQEAAEFAVDMASTWTAQLGGFHDVDGVRRVLSGSGRRVSKQALSKRKGCSR